MKDNSFYCVVTTIQQPTEAVVDLSYKMSETDGSLIVIGDTKGPETYEIANTKFLNIEKQRKLSFEIAKNLPTAHYARKNIGYLQAISEGAELIYETDDDNKPIETWVKREKTVNAVTVSGKGWNNVYQFFYDGKIWPRGYPLDELNIEDVTDGQDLGKLGKVQAPIQQGLANLSPDVDAVWRLVMDQEIVFEDNSSVNLAPGVWCPFNSQSTWWWPEAYPLMYLPSYCSFRMTDIWRSFIAQRCLWETGQGIVFHAPEVEQDRNEHDLMRDFSDEIPGYLRNKELVTVLESLDISHPSMSMGDRLLACYGILVEKDFFPVKELELVQVWLNDIEKLSR